MYLKAIAMSFPNFSRALSIISRGEAFSSSLASCSKSSDTSTFSDTSANATQVKGQSSQYTIPLIKSRQGDNKHEREREGRESRENIRTRSSDGFCSERNNRVAPSGLRVQCLHRSLSPRITHGRRLTMRPVRRLIRNER